MGVIWASLWHAGSHNLWYFLGWVQCKIRYPAIQVQIIWGTLWHAGKCNPKVPWITVSMNMSSEVPSDIKVNLFLGTLWVSDLKIHLLWGTSEPKDHSEVPSDMHVYSTVSADFNSLVTYVDHYLLTDSWDGSSHSTVDVPPKLLILMSTPGVLLVVWVVLLYTNLEYKTTCHHYKISHTVMKATN